jgi:hypothetical protein
LFGICRYVFGLTHIPRLEDWPVMPVERIGFMLMVSVDSVFWRLINTPSISKILSPDGSTIRSISPSLYFDDF